MSEGLKKVLNRNSNDFKKEKDNLLSLIKNHNSDDFNPTLALTIILEKLIDNFESKDIISRSMSKPYALLSSTNKVQKDIINEIISKQNDNKGQTKKMYFNIINNTLKSLKQSENKNENSFLNRLGIKR